MKFIKLNATKKEIFETAHDIAKIGIKKFGGNYVVAFRSALKYVYDVIALRVSIRNRRNLGAFGFQDLSANFSNGVLVIESKYSDKKHSDEQITVAYKKLSKHALLNC